MIILTLRLSFMKYFQPSLRRSSKRAKLLQCVWAVSLPQRMYVDLNILHAVILGCNASECRLSHRSYFPPTIRLA